MIPSRRCCRICGSSLRCLSVPVPQENAPAQTIITDFSRELNNAWHQLRELLTTFRLTLNHANLPAALQESLDGLQSQTQAKLHLDCRLSSLALDAQKQVHLRRSCVKRC